eukprot:XP_001709223.1 Hypothetical protein GL50803_38872 [Giardia lamblia ATCC 50803]
MCLGRLNRLFFLWLWFLFDWSSLFSFFTLVLPLFLLLFLLLLFFFLLFFLRSRKQLH